LTETILTIGHSTHPIEKLLELLGKNGVTALCDVRSAPYSRMNPQFNRETLRDTLQKAGIAYFFLGKELGARSDDPACYKNHHVQYELLEKTALFHKGLDKVCELAKKYRVALMCAEKDPLSCHRTILVARALAGKGFNIEHILANGAIETHDQAIARLLRQLHLPEADMFRAKDEIIDEAYRKQGKAIAYEEQLDTPAYGYS
jgi:uncharacterized protein (DUF488 family)